MALKRIKVNNTKYDINDARISGIVDNLASTSATEVLSGKQGKTLKDLIDVNTTKLEEFEKDASSTEIILTTSWTLDSTTGYYVQNVVITGAKSTDIPTLSVKLSGTAENVKAISREWSKVLNAETYDGGIKFYASSATTQELTVIVKGAVAKVNISEMTKEEAIEYFSDTFLKIANIDSTLSSSSTNPVQNKVITTALNNKLDTASYVIDSSLSNSSTNPVQNKIINSALNEKLSATGTAAKATADASGNVITDTYATKTYVDEQISAQISAQISTVINASY
jgi:hypothetical protein